VKDEVDTTHTTCNVNGGGFFKFRGRLAFENSFYTIVVGHGGHVWHFEGTSLIFGNG
jgi:hypothetical protein